MTPKHYMFQYIRDIPDVLQRTLVENDQKVKEISSRMRSEHTEKLIIIGLGSSYTAGVMTLPLLYTIPEIKCFVLPSTELLLNLGELADKKSLVLAVSRSGERGWVVDALKQSMEKGAYGVAITSTLDNLLAQHAQLTLVTGEGPEITFTKTKSVVCCTGLLMYIALELATVYGKETRPQREILLAIPAKLHTLVEKVEPQVASLFPALLDRELVMIGGSGSNNGVALESALILQEAADVPATGMDSGNLLHGPWGSDVYKWLNILLVSRRDLALSTKSLELAGNLGWKRLCIVEPNIDLASKSEYQVTLPYEVDPLFSGLSYLIPMQFLTYYWCLAKGLNPDAPPGMKYMLDAMLPEGRQEPEFRSTR